MIALRCGLGCFELLEAVVRRISARLNRGGCGKGDGTMAATRTGRTIVAAKRPILLFLGGDGPAVFAQANGFVAIWRANDDAFAALHGDGHGHRGQQGVKAQRQGRDPHNGAAD